MQQKSFVGPTKFFEDIFVGPVNFFYDQAKFFCTTNKMIVGSEDILQVLVQQKSFVGLIKFFMLFLLVQ